MPRCISRGDCRRRHDHDRRDRRIRLEQLWDREVGSRRVGAGQYKLDVLVAAADDVENPSDCTDDLVGAGYRVTVARDEEFQQIVASEHHAFGDTYSTTVDLVDW